jgi:formylglycine-generating enzyme required for sulfatase activity
MGTPGNNTESPQHEVTLSPFVLGKYPITRGQWKAIMGDNPSNFQEDNLPVETVTWDDAVEFCQELSTQTGLEFRLPSEAEWEYACRAGSKTSYSFGEDSNQLKEYAWYDYNSNNKTNPVGQKKPNAWGLYDLHGNVWEWCGDDWHDNYNGAPNDGSIWLNDNRYKVIRGGSCYFLASRCRCAYRYSLARAYKDYDNGFRVALGIPRTT